MASSYESPPYHIPKTAPLVSSAQVLYPSHLYTCTNSAIRKDNHWVTSVMIPVTKTWPAFWTNSNRSLGSSKPNTLLLAISTILRPLVYWSHVVLWTLYVYFMEFLESDSFSPHFPYFFFICSASWAAFDSPFMAARLSAAPCVRAMPLFISISS